MAWALAAAPGRCGIHAGCAHAAAQEVELARLHGPVGVAVPPVVGERRRLARGPVEADVPGAERGRPLRVVGADRRPLVDVPRHRGARERVHPLEARGRVRERDGGQQLRERGVGGHAGGQRPSRLPLDPQPGGEGQPAPPPFVLEEEERALVLRARGLPAGGEGEAGELEGAEEDGAALDADHLVARPGGDGLDHAAGMAGSRLQPVTEAGEGTRGGGLDVERIAGTVGGGGEIRALRDPAEVLERGRAGPAVGREREPAAEGGHPGGDGDAAKGALRGQGEQMGRARLPPAGLGIGGERRVAVLVHLLPAQGQERDVGAGHPQPGPGEEQRRRQRVGMAGERVLPEPPVRRRRPRRQAVADERTARIGGELVHVAGLVAQERAPVERVGQVVGLSQRPDGAATPRPAAARARQGERDLHPGRAHAAVDGVGADRDLVRDRGVEEERGEPRGGGIGDVDAVEGPRGARAAVPPRHQQRLLRGLGAADVHAVQHHAGGVARGRPRIRGPGPAKVASRSRTEPARGGERRRAARQQDQQRKHDRRSLA